MGGPAKKLKILALHSFRTSGAIFQEQMRRAGLDVAFAELADITFVDAPNSASGPIPDDVSAFFSPPYFEWWNAHKTEGGGWRYDGWRDSLAKLEQVAVQQGPFDGVMGFSQGAAAASLLVGMQRCGAALAGQPTLRFAVCFAGIRARDAKLERYYQAMALCPSVHIIGDRDPVKRLTNELIDSYQSPIVINHTKGHVIPALEGPDVERLKAFLRVQQAGSQL